MSKEMKFGYRVCEDIPRCEPELLKHFAEFSVPELCDGMLLYNAMDYHIKPMVTTKKIVGQAITLRLTMGDSLLVTKAISIAKAGDVLVIDGHGSCNNALWGDHRSLICKKLGLSGVVMDGAFRDIDGNEAIGFPIYARALTCGSSTKNSNGEINIPISCAGAYVKPGDIVVGDRNGVVVIPLECAEQVLAVTEKKKEKMDHIVDEIEESMKIIPDDYANQLAKLGY